MQYVRCSHGQRRYLFYHGFQPQFRLGDFVTSITLNSNQNNNKSNNNSNNANSSDNSRSNNNSGSNNNSSDKPAEASDNSSSSNDSDNKDSSETVAPTTVKPSTAVPTTAATESVTDSAKEVNGLREFDEQGGEVTDSATADEADGNFYVVWYVLGGIAVVLIAGFCVWYFGFFRKKKN